ncbi:MAG: hypothetical protein MJ238_05620 [Bacilli bacterium]|nr:hypothetical protein [Bacilli bacterium]
MTNTKKLLALGTLFLSGAALTSCSFLDNLLGQAGITTETKVDDNGHFVSTVGYSWQSDNLKVSLSFMSDGNFAREISSMDTYSGTYTVGDGYIITKLDSGEFYMGFDYLGNMVAHASNLSDNVDVYVKSGANLSNKTKEIAGYATSLFSRPGFTLESCVSAGRLRYYTIYTDGTCSTKGTALTADQISGWSTEEGVHIVDVTIKGTTYKKILSVSATNI